MHRGPGKRAGGSGPAWRSPARTDTLAHSPSRTPGAAQPRDSSSDGRLRPHMPGSRGAAGGSLPPLPPLPRLRLAGSFPRLRPSGALLRLPPPGLACRGCPGPVTLGGRATHSLPRAGRRGRRRRRDSWRRWPGCPGSGLLRRRHRRCVRLGPAASSLSGRDRSSSWSRLSLPRLPHAPDSTLLYSAPGTWLRVGSEGRARPAPAGRIPPRERIIGPRTNPPPPRK